MRKVQYKRKLKDGIKFWYKFDWKGKTYFSKAEFETKGQAKKAEADKLANLKNISSGEITFRELCELRMDLIKTKSDYYYKDHKKILKPLVKLWGNLNVSEINKQMINDYHIKKSADLIKRGKSNYQVNQSIRILKAMFNWALDQDLIDTNPLRTKLFPIDKKLKYIPPYKDIDKVISLCNKEQKQLIHFVRNTAARINEALRSRKTDFNNNKVVLWTRKNKRGDLVPRAVEYTPYWTLQDKTFSYTSYPRFLEDKCKEAKIKVFGWHSLRHLKASELAQTKTLIEIRDFLGHQDITTTNLYLQSLRFGYEK